MPEPGALLIVNDDVEAAIAIGADGLHVGQDDMLARDARERIGTSMILGLSVETEELAAAVDPATVDYAGIGPVFSTSTKPDHKPADRCRRFGGAGESLPRTGGRDRRAQCEPCRSGTCCGGGRPGSRFRHLWHARSAASRRRLRRSNQKGTRMICNVLSIAGSDPSGGAGIQADLKTFSARGTYGMAVLTALTAQNTHGVSGVHLVPPEFVAEQIRMVFADVRVDAVKIGMIANAPIAEAVANALAPHRGIPVVLDPVMIAKGGAALLDVAAIDTLKSRLLPLATLLTPNLPEAAALLGESRAETRTAMELQAEKLRRSGPSAVLVKGGHLGGTESPDVLVSENGTTWFEASRVPTKNTHGTGCTLSSALAAELAKGMPVENAVALAKNYLAAAVAAAGTLSVGSGHGPVQHFHQLWK